MNPSFAQLKAHVEEAEIKKKCISLVFRHQGPYEIKLNPKGISNVGYFCQSILVQKCSFRIYSAVYSKVLSVLATTLPKYRTALCYWQVLKMSFLVQNLNVFSFRKYSVVYKRVECAGWDPSKYRVTQPHPPPPITATASH